MNTYKSYVIIGTINEKNYNTDEIDSKMQILKFGSVRHKTVENRIKQLKSIINTNYYEIVDITEEYEKRIHKILRSNPFTKEFNIEIEKSNGYDYTEYYSYNNIIVKSLDFLIKNITKSNDDNEVSHYLTRNLVQLNLI